jgi:rubrerythrin
MHSPLYKRHRLAHMLSSQDTDGIVVGGMWVPNRRATPTKRAAANSMVDDAAKPMSLARRAAADCLKALTTALDLPGGKALRDDPAVGHMAHAATLVLFPTAARAVPAAAGDISAVALLAKLNPAPSQKPLPLYPFDSSSDEESWSNEKMGKSPAHSKNPLPRYPRGMADWTDSSDEDEKPGAKGGLNPSPSNDPLPGRRRSLLDTLGSSNGEEDAGKTDDDKASGPDVDDYAENESPDLLAGSPALRQANSNSESPYLMVGSRGDDALSGSMTFDVERKVSVPFSPPKRTAASLGDYQNAENARNKRANTSQAQENSYYCRFCSETETQQEPYACPYCGETQGSPGF